MAFPFLHDIYHALRELETSRSMFALRKSWYDIAVVHAHDRKSDESRPISEMLVDGELVYSFPKDSRSPFELGAENQSLAELLQILGPHLHEELKGAFIRNLVEGKNPPYEFVDLPFQEQVSYGLLRKKIKIEPESSIQPVFQTLYDSLPRLEQIWLKEAFDAKIERAVDKTVELVRLAKMHTSYDKDNAISRERVEDALYALKKGRFAPEQLATYHLFEMAIRNIYSDPTYVSTVTVNGVEHEIPASLLAFKQVFSSQLYRCEFNVQNGDNIPILKKYFNLNQEEWLQFGNLIYQTPNSEHYFYIFELPVEEYDWSSDMNDTRRRITCFEDQYVFFSGKRKKGVIVASFSMYQIFMNIKAKKRGTSFTLVPFYQKFLLNETLRDLLKNNAFPVYLYFPKYDPALRFNKKDGDYQSVINEKAEGPLSAFMRSLYFALTQIEISPKWNEARLRLASIAGNHKDNFREGDAFSIEQLLMNETTLRSYPDDLTSVVKKKGTPSKFGDIFSSGNLPNLSDSLRAAMIKDMADHKEEWREKYNIGFEDLNLSEQVIYNSRGKL